MVIFIKMVMITVKIKGERRKLRVKKNTSVEDLAKDLGIIANNYIMKKNDEIVPDTETVNAKDVIEFVRVISGG